MKNLWREMCFWYLDFNSLSMDFSNYLFYCTFIGVGGFNIFNLNDLYSKKLDFIFTSSESF